LRVLVLLQIQRSGASSFWASLSPVPPIQCCSRLTAAGMYCWACSRLPGLLRDEISFDGEDGLAWHTSNGGAFGNSTPGSRQVFLMCGPFVLPEWSTVNPTPGLSSALPSSATAGSANFTLTITGSNFVPGAVLTWNGAERTSTFVDGSHLTVSILASDVNQIGVGT